MEIKFPVSQTDPHRRSLQLKIFFFYNSAYKNFSEAMFMFFSTSLSYKERIDVT